MVWQILAEIVISSMFSHSKIKKNCYKWLNLRRSHPKKRYIITIQTLSFDQSDKVEDRDFIHFFEDRTKVKIPSEI